MTLVPFWDYYHHMMWRLENLVYKCWIALLLQDLMKKYLIPIPSSGVIQMQEIQAFPKSHLMPKQAGKLRDHLRGLTFAISASAQHYPYCYSIFLIIKPDQLFANILIISDCLQEVSIRIFDGACWDSIQYPIEWMRICECGEERKYVGLRYRDNSLSKTLLDEPLWEFGFTNKSLGH